MAVGLASRAGGGSSLPCIFLSLLGSIGPFPASLLECTGRDRTRFRELRHLETRASGVCVFKLFSFGVCCGDEEAAAIEVLSLGTLRLDELEGLYKVEAEAGKPMV
jgi:hypothetical protein